MTYIIGIDPGQTGGIAFLDADKLILKALRMPVFRPSKKNKQKTITYDIDTLVSLFDISVEGVQIAVLERVNTMPGQGIASNGKLMYGFGLMHGLIAKFPHELISAQKWKRKFGLSSDKELSRDLASERFPLCKELWKTKNRDGVAEATLLTLFALHELGLQTETKNIIPSG